MKYIADIKYLLNIFYVNRFPSLMIYHFYIKNTEMHLGKYKKMVSRKQVSIKNLIFKLELSKMLRK